jgi:hypothetical protein
MTSNTTGQNNTAVGYTALNGNTTGSYNTAIGASCGGSGNYNTAVGYLSGGTGGDYNVGIGNGTFFLGSSGSYNTAVGNLALYSLTSGAGNTAISPTTNTGSYSPVFDPTTQSNRFCMGSTAVTNAYIQVAWAVVSDARDKTDFGVVPHGLDFVSKLKPVAYRYKETRDATRGHGPLRYGFKAQHVLLLEGDTPVIVDNEDANKLRFNDQALLAVIVNAIKELKAEFDEYKATHP